LISEPNDIQLVKVSPLDRREFLSMYIYHRTELLSQGFSSRSNNEKEPLSKFFKDPDSNYLFWSVLAGEKVGFASVTVSGRIGTVEDVHITRERRGCGSGYGTLFKLVELCRYRGLTHLRADIPESALGIERLFRKAGFERRGPAIVLEL